MALHHRQLLQQICTIYCHFKDSSCASVDCLSCIQKCSIIIDSPPPDTDNYSLSPPSPSSYIDPDLENSSKPHNLPTFLISLIAVLAAAFLLVFCYAFYARFLSPYLRRRRTAAPQETEHAAHDGDDDDDVHGPILDHPIWYIRTTGLQQSIISAITVCKYKKGEGLIDGTECSVCLSEFEEDESLRLLPKCNHAFHLPCIDTWLRSHTNCPNCRAPIVTNPATVIAAAPEPRAGSSGEIHIDIVENSSGRSQIEEGEREEDDRVDQETEEEIEERSEGSGSRNEDVENLQGRRRSVSLDESYVQKINLALAGVATNDNTNNTLSSSSSSLKRVSKSNSSSFRIIGASMKRSRSYNGKHLMTSWYGRSQRKSNVPVRSF